MVQQGHIESSDPSLSKIPPYNFFFLLVTYRNTSIFFLRKSDLLPVLPVHLSLIFVLRRLSVLLCLASPAHKKCLEGETSKVSLLYLTSEFTSLSEQPHEKLSTKMTFTGMICMTSGGQNPIYERHTAGFNQNAK